MIRFRDKIIEKYFICPLTGDIFDKDGVVQKTRMQHDRPRFKGMDVHQIQAHTHYGYRPDKVVHHIDGNPLNNMLSNLDYSMTQSEHCAMTNVTSKKGHIPWNKNRNRPFSAEAIKKMSIANKGQNNPSFGKYWWTDGTNNIKCKECPGPEWRRGRIISNALSS